MAGVTVITLPQMVDLAVNSPEIGVVNFTVLHSLLHVIVKQLDLVDTNVEFRGSDSERLQNYIANAKPGPLLTLTEYTVGEETTGKEAKSKYKKGIHGSVAEKGKADEQQTEKGELKPSDSQNRVIVVESTRDITGGPTVVATKHHFDKLEEDVRQLRKKVKELAELPANSALIEVLRGDNPDKTPVLEMFQILNLSKRLDAAEVGTLKLASLMEDLAKKGPLPISPEEAVIFSEQAKELRSSLDDSSPAPTAQNIAIEKRLDKLEKTVFEKTVHEKRSIKVPQPTDQEPQPVERSEERSSAVHKPSSVHKAKEKPSSTSEKQKSDQRSSSSLGSNNEDSGEKKGGRSDSLTKAALDSIHEELLNHKDTLRMLVDDIDGIKKLISGNSEKENLPPELRLNQLENKVTDFQDQLNSLDHMFCRQVEILQKRITDLEKEAGQLVEKINLRLSNMENSQPEGQTVGELYNKLLQLQEEMSALGENSQKLLEDREDKQHSLDVMTEQIELLKTVKADREDLEDALADKADACMVNRKVSVEQFDTACEDMSKAIEDSLFKLSQQEESWSKALDDITKDVGNKLDKQELAPLRDYINKKLKGLHDKFRSLTTLKRENEAAGTKSRILKDVNCISCDKDVVMRKEIDSTLFPKPYALPPTRNMAPYLTYELDQLRKQQKYIPPTKDLNMFEFAMKSSKSRKGEDHLCNRYCGGSHTITTPQQRVTRLGHFLEQWGPEVATAKDTMIRGTDGHMYKGTDDKGFTTTIESYASVSISPDFSKNVQIPAANASSTPTNQIRKSSLRSPKGDSEIKQTPNVKGDSEPKQTPINASVLETPPPPELVSEPRRKSRPSIEKAHSMSKTRKRSKGSVKYSAKPSGEIKVTEIPEIQIVEEPAPDAEIENYSDPDA